MKTLAAAVAAALLATAVPAAAQDSSSRAVAAHFTAPQAATFSKQIEQDLAAKGARVAMVFRAGRPRSQLPEGIAYTHGAFWVYRTIRTADGRSPAMRSTISMPAMAWPGRRPSPAWCRTTPSSSLAARRWTTWR